MTSSLATLVSLDTWNKAIRAERRAEALGFRTAQAWGHTDMIMLVQLSEYDVIRRVIVQGADEAHRICQWWAGHRGGATTHRLDWAR